MYLFSFERSQFGLSESDGENSPEVQGALDELEPTEYLIMKKNVCNKFLVLLLCFNLFILHKSIHLCFSS